MELYTATSLTDYFRDALLRAAGRQQLSASEAATAYVVKVLLSFAFTTPELDDLSTRLAETRAAAPAERLSSLREVGDSSLYITGFFGHSLENRLLDTEYYVHIGQDAYRELAQARPAVVPSRDLYRELGEKFSEWVDVIGQVSEEAAVNSADGVVKLYERWLRTGSNRTERTLRAYGFVTARGRVQ